MNKKSITFLFGGVCPRANGGTKVVLQYANMLYRNGWDVRLVFSLTGADIQMNLFQKLIVFLSTIKTYLRYGISVKNWFDVEDGVKIYYPFSLRFSSIEDSWFYVATYVSTSDWLKEYPIQDERKFYFIQDYEIWGKGWNEKRTRATYHYKMKKLVISTWLQRLLKEEGIDSILLKNGFDFSFFKLQNPIEDRDPKCISFMFTRNPHKGVKYAIEAINIVKARIPDLKVKCFGTARPRPQEIENWIEYYESPDREMFNNIYNSSSIYVAASTYEGWGLTIGEAMICGNAIVCTSTDGFKEMVSDNDTAYIAPIKDCRAIADKICELIGNNEKRIRIAKTGNAHIQSFSWQNSFEILESVLLSNIEAK